MTKLSRISSTVLMLLAAFFLGRSAHKIFAKKQSASLEENVDIVMDEAAFSSAEEKKLTELHRKLIATIAHLPESNDTLDSVRSLGARPAYDRLALWLASASASDIAAYWQSYKLLENKSQDIIDLVFINWTRLDPQAAIASDKGTPFEQTAWWSWACHEPVKALAEAKAKCPERLESVVWGIGEFHSEWLRENFDQIPKDLQRKALQALVKWNHASDPISLLNFLKEQKNYNFGTTVLADYAKRDPWAAFDYAKDSKLNYWFTSNMLESLKENHPELLARMAEECDSNEMKSRFRNYAFENLLQENPEAAMKMANENSNPYERGEQQSKIALTLLDTDREQAWTLAADIFSHPSNEMNIDIGTGPLSKSFDLDSQKLANELIQQDGNRFIEQLAKQKSPQLTDAVSRWSRNDFPSYEKWFSQQSDEKIINDNSEPMVRHLAQQDNFEDAMNLAIKCKTQANIDQYTYQQWLQAQPDQARAWFEKTPLPDAQKQNLINVNPNFHE